jgi:5-methylcytosine-specific restriction endonuclease McrA
MVIATVIALAVLLLWRFARRRRQRSPVRALRQREPVAEAVRHEVWRRDQGSCVDCGSRERLEFDHIIPVSRGGSNTARNLELRCEPCNRRKGARI